MYRTSNFKFCVFNRRNYLFDEFEKVEKLRVIWKISEKWKYFVGLNSDVRCFFAFCTRNFQRYNFNIYKSRSHWPEFKHHDHSWLFNVTYNISLTRFCIQPIIIYKWEKVRFFFSLHYLIFSHPRFLFSTIFLF